MIIAFPVNGTVLFCDPITLLALESWETLKLGSDMTAIDFWPECYVYIMGRFDGTIFTYNPSDQTLKRLRSEKNSTVLSIAYINSQYYAFSLSGSQKIYLGSLVEEDNFLSWNSKNSDSVCLYNLAKRKLLFSGVTNGFVIIYQTDQLPKLPILYSHNLLQGEKMPVIKIDSVRICNRDYIITYGSDGKIRIWNLMKGRMRLIRRILIGQVIHSLVYLEEYKLLVITHGMYPALKFISLITGKFKMTIHVGFEPQKLFMMEDKRMIGAVDKQKNRVRMVKWCNGEIKLMGGVSDQCLCKIFLAGCSNNENRLFIEVHIVVDCWACY